MVLDIESAQVHEHVVQDQTWDGRGKFWLMLLLLLIHFWFSDVAETQNHILQLPIPNDLFQFDGIVWHSTPTKNATNELWPMAN